MGTLGAKQWLPIAVALGAVLNTALQYEGLSARLTAVNGALVQMQKVRATWNSMGVVERRMPTTKTMMVSVTEAMVLAEAMAHSGGVMAPKVGDHQKGSG